MKLSTTLASVSLLSFLSVTTVLAQTDSEAVRKAVLPLPEDLRAEAIVFTYDETTGERIILKEGSNHVECQPRNDEGFTRCFPTSDAARRDLSARLTAQGIEGDELEAALAEAEASGSINPVEFGSLRYRMYEEDDRIQLLWVVVLPNATSEMLGVSTASQRDNSLAGKGLPWMMREGTPNAHLMIPINGTEYSNQP